jgi:rhodanese-related sulfurtransferase
MSIRILKILVLQIIGYFIFFPQYVQAVIPPDFIFNIGMQISQFSSVVLIFFTAIFGTFFQYFKTKFAIIKYKKTVLTLVFLFVLFTSLISSYYYAIYKQKAEYQKWLSESTKYDIAQNVVPDSGIDDIVDSGEIVSKDENDQLIIGNDNNENINILSSKFVSNLNLVDSSAEFIAEYYKNMANGNLERAYEMSKKAVDFNTFKNWYIKTSGITLDKLVRIDEKKSSIELTLYEGESFTRYGVLMTLGFSGTVPIVVEKSEVKILAQGLIKNQIVSLDDSKIIQEYDFFRDNDNKNIFITNQEFKNMIDVGKEDYIVLDAREDIEYENGNFPGSLHIRFADLKAGRWIELSKDKIVYVICWSGIRGKEVAEFLRNKKIVSSYLEGGANSWVESGGKWVGSIKFGNKYTDLRYQKVFSTDEVRDKIKEGVILVDTREPYKFKQWHISGSINIPIMYTASVNIEDVFSKIPLNSNVIAVCDGYVNCFDAKITGVEAERRGNKFLGRYNKPWEYEK